MIHAAAIPIAVLLAFLAVPAAAQAPRLPGAADCLGRVGTPACSMAGLAQADGRLRAAFAEAASVTARPATLAARDAIWRDGLRDGLRPTADAPARLATPRDVADEAESYRDELREETRIARAVRRVRLDPGCGEPGASACPTGRPDLLARLRRSCLGDALRGCRVTGAGLLETPEGSPRRAWKRQDGHTAKDGVRGGIVILARGRDGWRPVVWGFEAAEYAEPQLVARPDGPLLTVAGRRVGSGAHNADLLLRLGDGRWRDVEIESWRGDLSRRLPEGLGAMQGVEYDFAAMTARTRLWRPEDGNCCPTGGSATASLRIAVDSLVLDRVEADPAPPS